MQRLRLKSLAKVNLDLRVLHKRADGYHELRTVFHTISLADTIEIQFEKSRRTTLSLDDPLTIPNNLVLRAAAAALDALKVHARLHFRLTKRIPMGGGLGGGSSNAASVLLALPFLAQRALPMERLTELALELGSDVPYFLLGGAALGVGRGEELYPLTDLAAEPLLVVASGVHVSTPDAYRALGRSLTFTGSSSSINTFQAFVRALAGGRSANAACALSANDFEAVVFRQYPQLKTIQAKLSMLGTGLSGAGLAGTSDEATDLRVGVRMSGSGSALYALFGSSAARARAKRVLEGDRVLRGCRLIPAELVSRRRYQRMWRHQLSGRLAADNELWPPQNRYAR
jgi:4-diphosphocytidyl-2-C-methyl-D-erythritol kinase